MTDMIDVHELEDSEDVTYVFALPDQADPGHVQDLAEGIQKQFDDAGILLASMDIESDMYIGEVDPDDVEYVEEDDI